MYAPHDRHGVALEPLDHGHVPERPCAVQSLGHEPGDQPCQIGASERFVGVNAGDVVGDVKLEIVNPNWVCNAQRRAEQAPTQAGRFVQASFHTATDCLDAWQLAPVRALEHHDLARVATNHPAAKPEDVRVLVAQTVDVVHSFAPHALCLAPRGEA